MRKTHWATALIISTSILTLVGCSKKHPVDMAADVGDAGAQAYGVSGAGGYTDRHGVRHNQYGEVINPLVGGTNQTYYFALDSSTPRPEDQQAISIQANYLSTHPNAFIRLEGNTDDRGSREYNVGLGWRRARAIASALGVANNQVRMVSYGKERPVALGNNEEAWHLNRRVDLVYEQK